MSRVGLDSTSEKFKFNNHIFICEIDLYINNDVYIQLIYMIVNLPYCSRIPGMRNKAAERSNTIKAVDV